MRSSIPPVFIYGNPLHKHCYVDPPVLILIPSVWRYGIEKRPILCAVRSLLQVLLARLIYIHDMQDEKALEINREKRWEKISRIRSTSTFPCWRGFA